MNGFWFEIALLSDGMSMTHRVVAITGGLGVLGQAVGNSFHAAGYGVALIDRVVAPVSSDGRMLFVGNADIATSGGAQTAIAQTIAHFGRLDALVNIAGGFIWRPVLETTPDDWDGMYEINLKTALCCCQAAVPFLQKSDHGRIINIGARAADRAAAGMAAYTASKAGVSKLTEALADELGQTSITVNAVLPTIIDTPRNRADMPNNKDMVAAEDIASLIMFLASPAAMAVTGALIPIVRPRA
jgi:NAD(P)-dependent dehydrogenase (short-subunit alcohol dehydrogenase family)